MLERLGNHRATIIAGLTVMSLWAGSGEARSHPEGRVGVPAMVARVLPAVVSITTRQIERDQFNEPVPTRGLGSGFIVDRQGHVLTNHRVIEGAQEINNLPIERGALVIRVDEGGPSAAAGIDPGDIVTSVGGKSIRDLHYLHDVLSLHRIGETVDVTVWRSGRTLALRLALEAEP